MTRYPTLYILGILASVLPAALRGQSSTPVLNEYSHVVTNLSLTTATSLSDGRYSYLSNGDKVQLVARYKDKTSDYNIIRVSGKDGYYMLSGYSENNGSVSLTIKLDGSEDPASVTDQQITLLKDTTRTDIQNQDFIVPKGKAIFIIARGKDYSKISTRYNGQVYCGYILTKYISGKHYKPAGRQVSDSRDKFDFSLIANKNIAGVYQIHAEKTAGKEVLDATIDIYIRNGLLKFWISKHKKSVNGKELYNGTRKKQPGQDDGFAFYDNASRLITLGLDMGIIHFSSSGTSTSENGLTYTIKRIK